jgi:pyruvate dehydrogenase E1 component beta subunit
VSAVKTVSNTSYQQALNAALREEMERDDRIVILGEDVGVFGGVYRVTTGLYAKFGSHRVIDTPISEDGFTGAAIGMALMGLRPIVEIMYPDFLPHAMNQLISLASKIEYMFNGKVRAPFVVRTAIIQGRSSGGDHSQVLAPFFMHVPGFQVIAPSTPFDAKGLLKSAIRSSKLTIFFEAACLYPVKGEVPEEEYLIPIGKAEVKKGGNDVTIVSFSAPLRETLSAAAELEKQGVSSEVIDLRTLVPMDEETLLRSISKTGRLVIVESSWRTCGVGSEVISLVAEKALEHLKAPIVRVSPPQVPEPMSPSLLKHYLVDEVKVLEAVKRVLA